MLVPMFVEVLKKKVRNHISQIFNNGYLSGIAVWFYPWEGD